MCVCINVLVFFVKAVTGFGGFKEMTKQRKWTQLAREVNHTHTHTHTHTLLKLTLSSTHFHYSICVCVRACVCVCVVYNVC